jgi:hypothetical protein
MNVLTTAKVGAYGIAAIAGVMSYGHQVTLLNNWGLGPYAYVVPVTVDVLAFLGALVRTSDVADQAGRRAAVVALLVASSASVAANVAVGENLVQRIVGVWTVAAYLLAEYFVSKLRPAPRPSPSSTTSCTPSARPRPARAPRPSGPTRLRPRRQPASPRRRPRSAPVSSPSSRPSSRWQQRRSARRERRRGVGNGDITPGPHPTVLVAVAEDRAHYEHKEGDHQDH